jgi:DNA polymerase III alpha subunit
MHIDNLGIAVYNSKDIEDILLSGQSNILDEILTDPTDPEILRYNQSANAVGDKELKLYQSFDIDKFTFDYNLQQNWLMPDEYKNLDIEQYISSLTPPWDPEATRVAEELTAFKERNMLDLLRWMKYFVDTCRNEGIVWGVGRGSSVASYVLYLIGVHKIDSLKYNLDWQEFLR